jgi:hypothetical protein
VVEGVRVIEREMRRSKREQGRERGGGKAGEKHAVEGSYRSRVRRGKRILARFVWVVSRT